MTTFARSVEAWRPLVEDLAGELPVDFLLKYIEVESGGNPCATGIAGVEAGLFQTYHPDDDRFGLTFAECRAGCTGSKLTRSLSDGEKRERVEAGIRMVQSHLARARTHVASNSLPWTEDTSDFWSLVKIIHGLPSVPTVFLPEAAAELGRAPDSFAEWRSVVDGLDKTEFTAACNRRGAPGLARFFGEPMTRVWANAEKTGAVFTTTRGSRFHVESYLGLALAFGAAYALGSILGGVA